MVASDAAAAISMMFLSIFYVIAGMRSARKRYEKVYKRVLEQTIDTEDALDPGIPKMVKLVKVRDEGDEESHWSDEKSLISV